MISFVSATPRSWQRKHFKVQIIIFPQNISAGNLISNMKSGRQSVRVCKSAPGLWMGNKMGSNRPLPWLRAGIGWMVLCILYCSLNSSEYALKIPLALENLRRRGFISAGARKWSPCSVDHCVFWETGGQWPEPQELYWKGSAK